mmetsp:Transcript_4375/g.12272  ORF Transcript_4375/g.12272 Transcript_4375/m.12272 type:complete len:202 (-) Transcript_4375:49-654(-)
MISGRRSISIGRSAHRKRSSREKNFLATVTVSSCHSRGSGWRPSDTDRSRPTPRDVEQWLACPETPRPSNVTTVSALPSFTACLTSSSTRCSSHCVVMPSCSRGSSMTLTLSTFSCSAAARTSFSRSLPSPSAFPVDKQSRVTCAPKLLSAWRVGAKNITSSSGCAVTSSTRSALGRGCSSSGRAQRRSRFIARDSSELLS